MPIFLYILSVALTQPPFIGDTQLYIGQIATAHKLTAPVLWEFGHILWRPIGFILSPLFMRIPDSMAWSPELKIAAGLVGLNLLSGLISTVLLYDLCRRLIAHPLWAMVPTFLLVWSAPFLSYSHSGVSYVPAFAAMIVGVWLQLVAAPTDTKEVDQKILWASACLFAIACLLWFPFVFVLPAAACSGKLVPLPGTNRWTWADVLATLVISGAVLGVGIAMAAFIADVRSISGLRLWMSSASHESHQNRRWIRAITVPAAVDRSGPGLSVLSASLLRIRTTQCVRADHPAPHVMENRRIFYLFVAALAWLAWSSVAGKAGAGTWLFWPWFFLATFRRTDFRTEFSGTISPGSAVPLAGAGGGMDIDIGES